MLFHHVLHHPVIVMGVDPQVGALGKAPVQRSGKNAAAAVTCDPVNGSVFLSGTPSAIHDPQVCGILTQIKIEHTVNLIFKKVYVRISDVVDLGIHRQTAAAYLDQLVDEGLLSKEKIGRENIYKNVKLLALFENDSEVTV